MNAYYSLFFGVSVAFTVLSLIHPLYAIDTDPNGNSHGATTSGVDNWTSNQTYYWDFSQADNYVDGSVQQNFDTWEITNLTKGGGKLTIEFSTWEGGAGFGSGNLTGDYGQEDSTAQIDYSTLTPGYWFNDIVVVSGGDGISSGDILLNTTTIPGGASKWTKYVSGDKLSLRYDGSFPAGYASAPEPSTYIMVSGLLGMPLWRAFRRFRKTSVSKSLGSI